MRILTSAAAAAAVLAAPAFAAGPSPVISDTTVAPAMAPAPVSFGRDWTGGYVGGQIGYADLGGDGVDDSSLDGYGGTLGVHAGYMHDFGSYVLGAEVDWDSADFDVPLSDSFDADGAGAIDSMARLKFRAGYDMGQTLPYVTAGFAQANPSGFEDAIDTDSAGWLAGVGVAYQVTDQWIVGGELLQHRFDDFATNGLGESISLEATTVSLRASFRF